MNMINYKQAFIRFLKEKKLYDDWLRKVKESPWSKSLDLFFKLVPPSKYIEKSVKEDIITDGLWRTTERFYEYSNFDFEWRVICYEMDEKNEVHLKTYLNSNYGKSYFVKNHPIYPKYKHLLNKVN